MGIYHIGWGVVQGPRSCELPDSCLEGIISVLYKKGAKDDPRNYRPISLLNCDYKIFTRILTQRMNTAVLQFVSPQQTGFVQNSFIAENLMLLKLLQAKVEDEDEEAIFLFLDMEKAFDRCSWPYLKSSLSLPPRLRRHVHRLRLPILQQH